MTWCFSAASAVKTPGSVVQGLERLLLPNACVSCERWVGDREPDALVCDRCRLRLQPLLGGCERCRQPLPPIGACRFCTEWPAELRWARSAVWLDHEAREVVHHLKYRGYQRLASFMAALIARHTPRPAGGVLVPIPLTRRRFRERGFNQASSIARALSRAWGLPAGEELLTRRREAGSQTALTPEERLANVADAFWALPPRPHPAGEAAGDGVIIVDDVLTTGATLTAAASALAAAGWRRIGAVTFARALPFERRVI